MDTACRSLATAAFCASLVFVALSAPAQDIKEKSFDAPNQVKIKVRMEGPYTADVPLQVVCYFKYSAEGAKRMSGAPVELDKELGGVIASLRERGEFVGDELETLGITPPKNSIKAGGLLLVGLGSEESLSLSLMERIGRISLREAAERGAKRVAFAPLLRDQGNFKLPVGEVEVAVVRGVLLAYDTHLRLQKEGLAKSFALEEWIVEAGPTYFDETVTGVEKAIAQATTSLKSRSPESYRRSK